MKLNFILSNQLILTQHQKIIFNITRTLYIENQNKTLNSISNQLNMKGLN
jgi:hypothetical protein